MIAHTPMRVDLYARTCVNGNRLHKVFSTYETVEAELDLRMNILFGRFIEFPDHVAQAMESTIDLGK